MNKASRISAAAAFMLSASGGFAFADGLDTSLTITQNAKTATFRAEHKACTSDKYLVTYTFTHVAPLRAPLTDSDMEMLRQSYFRNAEAPVRDMLQVLTRLETHNQVQEAAEAHAVSGGLSFTQRARMLLELGSQRGAAMRQGLDKVIKDGVRKIGPAADPGDKMPDTRISVSPAPSPLCR